MEEVTEDIDAETGEIKHPSDLNAQSPHVIKYIFETLLNGLATYGWFILFLSVSLIIAWSSFLEPKVKEWRRRRRQMEEDAALHKDPDLAIARQEAMMKARMKLQEQHDRQAEIHREKEKKREEEKANKKIDDWDRQQTRLPTEPSSSNFTGPSPSRPGPTQRFRNNDYNPLMGHGYSRYAPPRRGGGG